MVDLFSSKCTSFRFVVFEKDSFLDCLERMKSSRIVVESRITLRCIYLSLFLFLYVLPSGLSTPLPQSYTFARSHE